MASLPQAAQATLLPLASGKTDVGRRRDHNEDQVLVSNELGVYAVADGMGGHQAGDVASSVAAAALEDFFSSEKEPVGIPDIDELPPGAQRLVAAVHHMNEEVFAKSGRSANQGGMGSTVVAIHVSLEEQLVHICHVGDSRCYRIREGDIELLTEDHSMINEALRLNPDLSEDILKQLPTNVVTRALGTKESVRPDVRSEPLVAEDIYLLCSDGLSGEVTDDEMLAAVLETGTDVEEGCELLVAMANEAGGRDNVSALLVRIVDPEEVEDSDDEAAQSLVVVDSSAPAPMAAEGAMAEARSSDEAVLETGELDDEEAQQLAESAELPWRSRRVSDVVPDEGDEDDEEEGPVSAAPADLEEVIDYARRRHRLPPDDSLVCMPVMGIGKMAPPPSEGQVRRCRSCSHRLLAEEKFCGMCGARCDEDEDLVARCDACGHEVLLGTSYCVECGVLHGF